MSVVMSVCCPTSAKMICCPPLASKGFHISLNQQLISALYCMLYLSNFFKASALWADAFYKSKCPSVCVFVCPSVCLSVCSLLRYRLTVFFFPLPEVGCQIFLEIRNPWGKVMERSGLTFEHFCLEMV